MKKVYLETNFTDHYYSSYFNRICSRCNVLYGTYLNGRIE